MSPGLWRPINRTILKMVKFSLSVRQRQLISYRITEASFFPPQLTPFPPNGPSYLMRNSTICIRMPIDRRVLVKLLKLATIRKLSFITNSITEKSMTSEADVRLINRAANPIAMKDVCPCSRYASNNAKNSNERGKISSPKRDIQHAVIITQSTLNEAADRKDSPSPPACGGNKPHFETFRPISPTPTVAIDQKCTITYRLRSSRRFHLSDYAHIGQSPPIWPKCLSANIHANAIRLPQHLDQCAPQWIVPTPEGVPLPAPIVERLLF